MDTSFKGILFDPAGRVLLGRNPREEWELLGGRADPEDADPGTTIRREFREEAGLEVEVGELLDYWYYDIAGAGRIGIVSYVVTTRGKAELRTSDEHADLRWFPLEQIDGLPMPEGYRRSIRKAAALRVQRGRIILLNGPSSSGKSSIGRAMLPLLDDPWFLVPVDAISGMRSLVHRRELDEGEVADLLRRTRLGYHRTVAALVSAGNDVIMDYPLTEPWRLADLLEVLDGFEVTLVHVETSPEELARREQERGDRPSGLAATQRPFEHGDADIVVDTTHASPEECAAEIVAQLGAVARPRAFERLREKD